MVKPCLSAAIIDSSSRTDPPGWMIALIPAAAISSILSAKGKKASEARAAPSRRSLACSIATVSYTHLTLPTIYSV